MSIPRLAWVEIDPSALANNISVIRKHVGKDVGVITRLRKFWKIGTLLYAHDIIFTLIYV